VAEQGTLLLYVHISLSVWKTRLYRGLSIQKLAVKMGCYKANIRKLAVAVPCITFLFYDAVTVFQHVMIKKLTLFFIQYCVSKLSFLLKESG